MIKKLDSGAYVGDTAGLRKLQASGATVHNAFGPECTLTYEPRNKFDPQPWTDGFLRYRAFETFAALPGTEVSR